MCEVGGEGLISLPASVEYSVDLVDYFTGLILIVFEHHCVCSTMLHYVT